MILKLIIFGLIIYGIYRFLGGDLALFNKKSHNKNVDRIDTLVECDSCSTYVTKKDAIKYKGGYYCSKECLPN
jgi:uncharacterized protein